MKRGLLSTQPNMKSRNLVGRKIVRVDHEWIKSDARIRAKKVCIRLVLDDGSSITPSGILLEHGVDAQLVHHNRKTKKDAWTESSPRERLSNLLGAAEARRLMP